MKAVLVRFLLAFAVALLLSGCGVAPVAKDGTELTAKQGLLAFHVTSNADSGLSYVEYASTSTFATRFNEEMVGPMGTFRIKAGEKFYLVPLDAGEYMFSKFFASSSYAWIRGTNRFTVRAHAITYIGHIGIRVADQRFTLRAFDRELEMRTYLADAYPMYFQTMQFHKAFAELSLR